MKIKEIKVPKSKDLFHAHFWTKTCESFFKWWKTTKILQKYFVQGKMWNIWAFLGNKLKGWSHKLGTLHEDNVGPNLKKARKQQIYGGSPSLWISGLKNTNISQIFAYSILAKQIFGFSFQVQCSTGPLNFNHILSAASLNCNWFFGNSTAAEDCFQLVPKFKLKVKLQRR